MNASLVKPQQKVSVTDFVAADMPTVNRWTVGITAMLAEEERRMISKRTKDALAAAKRPGVKLGGDRSVRPTARARKLAIEVLRERAAGAKLVIAKLDRLSRQSGPDLLILSSSQFDPKATSEEVARQ